MFEILEFLDIEHLGAIVNQNSAGDDLLVTSREFRDLLNRHLQSMTSNWQQMHNRIGEIEQNVDFAKKDRAILHSRVTQVERKGADLEVKVSGLAKVVEEMKNEASRNSGMSCGQGRMDPWADY